MKITADTNVLVRAMMGDDGEQSGRAQVELASAETICVALPALCELVWVLSRGYKICSPDIAAAIRRLIDATNVLTNRPAVQAGLAVLEAGGDFADGAIAYEGNWLGADVFVSFDAQTVRLLEEKGRTARLPA